MPGTSRRDSNQRLSGIEPLEERRLLAVVPVDSFTDVVDGDTSSITQLQMFPGPSGITLREAIIAANNTPGDDTIQVSQFEPNETFSLMLGALPTITEDLTIEGNGLTVDARQISRAINVADASGSSNDVDVTLKDLTLTRGKTTLDNTSHDDHTHSGGAVRFLSVGTLTLENTLVASNSTEGEFAKGGGVFSLGHVVVKSGSEISRNRTDGNYASGGGIYAVNSLTVEGGSKVEENVTDGSQSPGGGIAVGVDQAGAGDGFIESGSIVNSNRTSGKESPGGGVFVGGTLVLRNSAISNNATSVRRSSGGGAAAHSLYAYSATISGNKTTQANSDGGGIAASIYAKLTDSTVVDGNYTSGRGSAGGGITTPNLTLEQSTISNNFTTAGLSSGASLACTITGHTITAVLTLGSSLASFVTVPAYGGSIQEDLTCPQVRTAPGGGAYVDNKITSIDSKIFNNYTKGGEAPGGGLWGQYVSLTEGTKVYNNFTLGESSSGGGVFGKHRVVANYSFVFGNSVRNDDSSGGGIEGSSVLIENRSNVFDNYTTNAEAPGGGVAGSKVDVLDSTIANNQTRSSDSGGGGVYAREHFNMERSLIQGNATRGVRSEGGGVFTGGGLTIGSSIIAGNSTARLNSDGGGIYTALSGSIRNSTISGNSTDGLTAFGGGIYSAGTLRITNSIVLGNSAASSDDEIALPDRNGLAFEGANIVGATTSNFDASGEDNAENADPANVFATVVETLEDNNSDGEPEAGTGIFGGKVEDNGGQIPTIALQGDNPAVNPALDAAGFAHLRRGLEFNGTTDFTGNATEFVELQNPLPIGDRSHTVEVWVKVPSAGTGGLGENERVGIILGNLNSNTDPGNANWEIDDEGKLRIF